MPLRRETIDALTCHDCGTTVGKAAHPMAFNARCHPSAGVSAWYTGDGVLHLICKRCDAPVADIEVAP